MDSFIGVDPVTAAAGTSAPIIMAAVKFLKDLGIEPGDVLDAVKKIAPGAEPLGNFEATDAETAEAAGLTKLDPSDKEMQTTEAANVFSINPLYIIGAAGVAFLLFKKKKGKK